MAASFAIAESYGAGPTRADTSYINLLSADVASGATLTAHVQYPLRIPTTGNSTYSFERWLQAHFTGSFTQISAIKFYQSGGTHATGVKTKAGDKGNSTYVQAVNTASSIATSDIPVTLGTALTITPNPVLTAPGYSDYVVLQRVLDDTAISGTASDDGDGFEYTVEWDEI